MKPGTYTNVTPIEDPSSIDMVSQSCDYLCFHLCQRDYVSVYLSDGEQNNLKSYEQKLIKFLVNVDIGPDDYTLVMFWIPGGL